MPGGDAIGEGCTKSRRLRQPLGQRANRPWGSFESNTWAHDMHGNVWWSALDCRPGDYREVPVYSSMSIRAIPVFCLPLQGACTAR